MSPETRTARVKARARELGFDACGVTDLAPIPHRDALTRWLRKGMAGSMSYMHRQAARRAQPALIDSRATRAVVVTCHYDHQDPPEKVGTGRVAKYARGPDYHDLLRPRLEDLAGTIRELGGSGTVTRSYVDAGPVPERELAQRANLGWIGKNTMLIDPERGSFSFLATVLTNAGLAIDSPFQADRCGTCRRCLDACPTDAFPEPRVLDATRCISYLTIEYRGEVDPTLKPDMGDWVFGCDVCQDVCPWNEKFATTLATCLPGFEPASGRIDLEELRTMPAGDFEERFGRTPLARSGVAGMSRNAEIASANQAGAGRAD